MDAQESRCSAREGLTLEHTHPFALGGETTADNLRLLCAAHNRHTARKQLGEAQIEQKILESEYERAHRGLRNIGFSDKLCKKALAELRKKSRATGAKELIVEALAVLVPDKTPSMVRDSSHPRWPLPRAEYRSWDGVGHTSARPVAGDAPGAGALASGGARQIARRPLGSCSAHQRELPPSHFPPNAASADRRSTSTKARFIPNRARSFTPLLRSTRRLAASRAHAGTATATLCSTRPLPLHTTRAACRSDDCA